MEITLKILKDRYSKKLNKLIDYGNLGLYGDDGIVAYEEALGISKKYSDELFKMAVDEDFNGLVHYDDEDDSYANMDDDSPEFLAEFSATYAPCHALMALASLEADDYLKKIMDKFDGIDPFDDHYLFAFDYYIASIYGKNIDFVNTILLDKKESDEKRIRIFYIFEEISKNFKDEKSFKSIEEVTIKLLKSKNRHAELNALALNMLVLMDGVKHIEFIRECCNSSMPIDGIYLDKLEDIEIKLGLREKATIKKPSIEELKVQEEEVEKNIPKKNLVGRNDPCPCGSGKKYKKCCINKQQIDYRFYLRLVYKNMTICHIFNNNYFFMLRLNYNNLKR